MHPSATIDPSAQIAATAVIGPHVTVEAGAVIGENVRLDANVVIGRGTRIGADSHLYPNVAVYYGCKLGERVIVHAGAVIGSDGFGFAPDFVGEGDARTGSWVKIPQVGGVSIRGGCRNRREHHDRSRRDGRYDHRRVREDRQPRADRP